MCDLWWRWRASGRPLCPLGCGTSAASRCHTSRILTAFELVWMTALTQKPLLHLQANNQTNTGFIELNACHTHKAQTYEVILAVVCYKMVWIPFTDYVRKQTHTHTQPSHDGNVSFVFHHWMKWQRGKRSNNSVTTPALGLMPTADICTVYTPKQLL